MKEEMKMDLRTEAERKRAVLHDHIRSDYQRITKNQPHVRPYRVMTSLGQKYGWTTQGIASLLKRMGVYAPSTACK
jgi:hypothetical protein